MVGDGIRRRGDRLTSNNTNVFAALGALRKKKKKSVSVKEQGSLKGKCSSSTLNKQEEEEEKKKIPELQVLWALTPLIAKSWADVEDDDDDYYSTTAPDLQSDKNEILRPLEESGELEEDVDGINKEHVTEVVAVLLPSKDPNRQLSKKELKKKGLAELDAVLAELGYPTKSEASGQDDPNDKEINKNSKMKKKKDKTFKEAKDTSSMIDVKEKKKKKKPSKEMDSSAKAVANEAAVRNAKMAASKKKDKTHYNQHPLW